MTELENIISQLQPQIQRDTVALRLKIANKARYHAVYPNHPYTVQWDGQTWFGESPRALVDQVIEWLKQPIEDRAKKILARM
jgi:hypothetical protein